jgi:hypothetical protein
MDDARSLADLFLLVVPTALAACVLAALALNALRSRFAARPAVVRRRTASPEAPASDPARAVLHVVVGPSGRLVAHAAAEICAPWLARRERVLLVDGGPRLRLHTFFGASVRRGLGEYLAGRAPLLALIQNAGASGFWLLVHGPSPRGRDWDGLERLLRSARVHFDRVVLAVDLGAHRSLGSALARLEHAAWWAGTGPEGRSAARDFVESIGVPLAGVRLTGTPRAMREFVRARVEALRVADLTAATLGATPASATAAATPRRVVPAAAAVLSALGPVVASRPRRAPLAVEDDARVRERLRFLLWMRRVRSSQPAARDPVAPPSRESRQLVPSA